MKIGDKQKSGNIVIELFLIASVALFWVQRVLEYTQYLDAYNSTFSTNASCAPSAMLILQVEDRAILMGCNLRTKP